jgi:hypothetical protein
MKLMLQHRIVALVMIVSGGISTYALPSLAGDFHSQNSYRHSQSQVSFSTDGLPSTRQRQLFRDWQRNIAADCHDRTPFIAGAQSKNHYREYR